MSQFHLVYDTVDGYTIQTFTDQREVNLYVEEHEVEMYSVVKGKFLGHFFNEEILADESEKPEKQTVMFTDIKMV